MFMLMSFVQLWCPPCVTLFPYTTLFRSRVAIGGAEGAEHNRAGRYRYARKLNVLAARAADPRDRRVATRSEEHTSELQSLRHLVCRLLLEKKKILQN